ncbi:MAG: DUF4417 domain-containing protein [Patescibacteria group bacterium]
MSRLDVPDCLFPSRGLLQIPELRLDMQADFLDLPVLQWGTRHSRRFVNKGTWHFYSPDYRFQSIWDSPDRLVETEAHTAVEPNPSIFDQTPTAMAVGLIYKKRWVARYWQERGVKVFVDLNVAERHMSLNLRGVPQGWRAYATRGYAERPEDIEREFQVACKHRGSADVLFLVVGGVKVRPLCERLRSLFVPLPRNTDER